MRRKVKKHGFIKPLNCLQILSWFIFFLDLIVFFSTNLYVVPYEDDNIHGIAWFGVFYFLLAAVVVTLAVMATRMDPTDPLVY